MNTYQKYKESRYANERKKQDLINPPVIVLESIMNFEVGQTVQVNLTSYPRKDYIVRVSKKKMTVLKIIDGTVKLKGVSKKGGIIYNQYKYSYLKIIHN